MADWNYYTPKGLRTIGVSNETQDLSAWYGTKRDRTVKAYCKSAYCNKSDTGSKEIKHYDNDETCPHCGSYLFFSTKKSRR